MANFYKKSQISSGGAQPEKSQKGRSMIEMLGVLSIIGVLSLVSISAYSQAMFKYQLNKYTEDYSTFLGNVISLFPEVRRQHGRGTSEYLHIESLFADTSMLPPSMNYDSERGAIYDLFKNKNRLTYRLNGNQSEYCQFIYMQPSDDKISARDRAICRNIFLVAKENYDDIYSVRMYNTGGNDTLFGGRSNERGRRLKDAGLNEIDNTCNRCNSKTGCTITICLISRLL